MQEFSSRCPVHLGRVASTEFETAAKRFTMTYRVFSEHLDTLVDP